jgi:hypothetical protein
MTITKRKKKERAQNTLKPQLKNPKQNFKSPGPLIKAQKN